MAKKTPDTTEQYSG